MVFFYVRGTKGKGSKHSGWQDLTHAIKASKTVKGEEEHLHPTAQLVQARRKALEVLEELHQELGGKGTHPERARLIQHLRTGIMRGKFKNWEELILALKEQGMEKHANRMLSDKDLRLLQRIFEQRGVIAQIEDERRRAGQRTRK